MRGPGSPPVPIVHSPPRKLTKQDHEDWKIPPCISNWKNQRGLTIALDKRLAADGRGLQKPQINDKFAQFAESLYLAERNAREMVEQRSEINRLTAERDRREKEQALADMAARARSARTNNYEEEDDDDQSRAERDRLRDERRKQTEREMRLENLKGKRKREEDRDISERIALGQAAPTLTGESMFDQRLFNQDAGIGQGFGDDDSYSAFDKPLFQGTSAHQMFRPKKGAEEIYGSEADLEALKTSTRRFQPDRGFQGAESDGKARRNPVEFERQPGTVQNDGAPTDDFDFLDDYMDEAKTAKMDDALSKTTMSAPRRPVDTGVPSRSPINRRSRSPSPRRRRSPSPRRRRSPSPRGRRSPSPRRRRSPSPYRRGRRSPSPRRSPERRSRDDRRGYRRSPYDRDRRDYRRSPRRDYRRSPERDSRRRD